MKRIQHIKKISSISGKKLKFHQTLQFPENFYWGTSTSAHQIEGDNMHNDWWAWENRSKERFRSGKACNGYKLYEEDVLIMKNLGFTSYRFSIEWSRIEPKKGSFDASAMVYYRNLIALLNKNNIKPFVTLHHFTNPLWFSSMGGWEKSSSVIYFQKYIQYVVDQLGDLVDFWITINEPLVYCTQSYLIGIWPPEQKSYFKTYKTYSHLMRAHKVAYRTIHALYRKKNWHKPKVAFCNNAVSLYSYEMHSFRAWLFIRLSDWLWNHSFYTFTRQTHDFIGINYYFHYRLKGRHLKALRFFCEARNEHREMTQIGWEVYPQGIFDVLIDMKKYKLPIYITENGIATINESKRIRYLISYIKEIYHAVQAGVKVRGYFYWSFIDNFEWEKGFRPRFGLVEVNFKDFTRKIRHAAEIYSKICKSNSLPHNLLRYLGHSVDE